MRGAHLSYLQGLRNLSTNIQDLTVKDLINDPQFGARQVMFDFYREGVLYYKVIAVPTESGDFSFPVPCADLAGAIGPSQEKAIYFMRWIRPHLKNLKELDLQAKAAKSSLQE